MPNRRGAQPAHKAGDAKEPNERHRHHTMKNMRRHAPRSGHMAGGHCRAFPARHSAFYRWIAGTDPLRLSEQVHHLTGGARRRRINQLMFHAFRKTPKEWRGGIRRNRRPTARRGLRFRHRFAVRPAGGLTCRRCGRLLQVSGGSGVIGVICASVPRLQLVQHHGGRRGRGLGSRLFRKRFR